MILIADSGGTKIEWCLIDGSNVVSRFFTPGINAMMMSEDELCSRLAQELVPNIENYSAEIAQVYFYGAGCVSPAVCASVANAIMRNIPVTEVEVATDLLGAARGLCGHQPGLVCILGTGSNSCYYDGAEIVDNVSPLGFILGDEGSGAYLGKVLVGDVLKRQLPEHICRKFLDKTGLDAVSIVQNVYRKPYPQRFLASLSPFLLENIAEPAVHELVINAFKAFFKRNVCLYTDHHDLKVFCTGSVAFYYKDYIAEAAKDYGFELGNVIQAPMDGLIKYHMTYD